MEGRTNNVDFVPCCTFFVRHPLAMESDVPYYENPFLHLCLSLSFAFFSSILLLLLPSQLHLLSSQFRCM
jgi:hypothetical protein